MLSWTGQGWALFSFRVCVCPSTISGVSDHLHVNKVFLKQAQKVEVQGEKDSNFMREKNQKDK